MKRSAFKCGYAYETKISNILKKCTIHGEIPHSITTAGSKHGSDISILLKDQRIGFETKNKGGFEGGVKKLTFGEHALEIKEDCIHKEILGNTILYNGMNLPYYEGRKTKEDWDSVKEIFKHDVYIECSHDAISNYYSSIGTHYIQIEDYGIFHTGNDILQLNVPYFQCKVKLRIRCTKHVKKGIPTDITGGLQFNKRTLQKSPYSLDGCLPHPIQLLEE